jgi:DNA-binding PadR family transcriptional regulator
VPAEAIPNRAETLQVLRLLGDYESLLMLGEHAEDYGTRWTLGGQQVEPAIARYLLTEGFIAERGRTELGARVFRITPTGQRFREDGVAWWGALRLWQRLKVRVFG